MRSESATIKPITLLASDGVAAGDKNETVARIRDVSHWVSAKEGESQDKNFLTLEWSY